MRRRLRSRLSLATEEKRRQAGSFLRKGQGDKHQAKRTACEQETHGLSSLNGLELTVRNRMKLITKILLLSTQRAM